ncbi:MAG: hypothetical protein CMH62_01440 [Nanoarchaeota archaeon]|nr:hypothetical protein [Nanoarchaeota archaeon]
MIFDFLLYSFNSLKARKTRTLLTMVGIFIGIAAVVSLISLGAGLQKAVESQFAAAGTDKIIVQAAETGFGPPGSTALERLGEDDFKVIKSVNGIKTAAKRYVRAVNVEFKDKSRVEVLTSLPRENDARELVIDAAGFELIQGRMLKTTDKFKVVVGNSFHTEEKFPRVINNGDKLQLNGYDFDVVGVLDKAGNPQLNGIFIVNEPILEEILDIDDEADLIIAQVTSVKDVDKTVENVKKALRKSRDVDIGKEDFSVETPQQTLDSVNTVLNVVNIVLIGIAAISLIVGGIGIMNTMYTSVLERTREIGIMKSIGATNGEILSIFLIESGILGLVGGGIGVFLGVGFSKLVEYGASVALGPNLLLAEVSLTLVIGSLVFSFLIGTVSGILPARQASKLQPVDALRQ